MTVYPPVDPVPPDTPRPFWSVMVPTFNPTPAHLAQALASVLMQDPGPGEMEIAVIDDHSSDVDPKAAVTAPLRSRISWWRQERRVGIADNWNECIRRARGRWVHILHQDDVLRPGFYASLRAGIDAAPASVGAAFCRDVVIDSDGQTILPQVVIRDTAGTVDDWIEHVFVALHLRASAVVVRRSVYETIGAFSPDLHYALDWDMWKRIAAAYPLWYEPDELACCRRHSGSASFDFMRSGANIAEIRRSIQLSEALLDPAIAPDVTRRARAAYTNYAALSSWRSLKERQFLAGLAQLREARKLWSPLRR